MTVTFIWLKASIPIIPRLGTASPTSGFLTLGTVVILGQMVLCREGLSCSL